MWHEREKPLISSFSWKARVPCVNKNFTSGGEEKLGEVSTIVHLERTKIFKSFSDSITQCLDLTRNRRPKADERLEEVIGGLPRLLWSSMTRMERFQVVDRDNLRQDFPHAIWTAQWSFCSCMGHELFKKNLKLNVFCARVTSSVYCSMLLPTMIVMLFHLPLSPSKTPRLRLFLFIVCLSIRLVVVSVLSQSEYLPPLSKTKI